LAILSLGKQLEEIQVAISQVLTSQEYIMADGRKMRRADLEFLRAMRKDLNSEIEDKGYDFIPSAANTQPQRNVPVSFV